MSSAKKGKKKKCKTVDLMSFLADGSGTTPAVPVKPLNWADDVEEEYEGYSSRSSKEPVVLPTAPRAARGPRVADEDIPNYPPYVAYLSNLPYEVDEDYLTEFFADMKIGNIRLPKDSNKLKGFGYVEFEDRQSLIDALCLSNTPMKTRRVRIDVSNSVIDDRRGGRMGRDNRRDNYDDPERTSGDWRSGPRDDPAPEGDSYRNRYENRDRRDDREAPEYDNKPGAWRDGNDRGRSTFRGFRDDDKDKEWSRYDKGSRDRDGDKSSSFGPRRNFGDFNGDRDGRRQARPPPTTMDSKADPKSRPKLQLQPRSKPVEAVTMKEQPAAPATNIFGAAKPVDTTAREREIEERLAKSYVEFKPKEEGDSEKRAFKEGAWLKRNGEGRDDKEKERGRPAWRSEDDGGRPAWRSEDDGGRQALRSEDDRGRQALRSEDDRGRQSLRSEDDRGRQAWRADDDRGRQSLRSEDDRGRQAWRADDDRGRQAWRSEDDGGRQTMRSEDDRGRPALRSEDDRGRRTDRSAPRNPSAQSDQYRDSKEQPPARGGRPSSRGRQRSNDTRGADRDRRDKEKDDVSRMPKAKDGQAPNFVASNKYSMLPDDVDPNNIDD